MGLSAFFNTALQAVRQGYAFRGAALGTGVAFLYDTGATLLGLSDRQHTIAERGTLIVDRLITGGHPIITAFTVVEHGSLIGLDIFSAIAEGENEITLPTTDQGNQLQMPPVWGRDP